MVASRFHASPGLSYLFSLYVLTRFRVVQTPRKRYNETILL